MDFEWLWKKETYFESSRQYCNSKYEQFNLSIICNIIQQAEAAQSQGQLGTEANIYECISLPSWLSPASYPCLT